MPSPISPSSPTASRRTETRMEGAVLANKAAFVSLLKKTFPGQAVDEVKPSATSAGATMFPKATVRYFVHPPNYGHDGIQVAVTGNELLVRDTYSNVAGTTVATGPVDLKTAVAEARAQLTTNLAAAKKGVYTVEKGDTLYRLSREFGVTMTELKKLNRMTSNLIVVGQKLKVPKLTDL